MEKSRLRAMTKRSLDDLAKKKGIVGYSRMTKDTLVEKLAKSSKPKTAAKRNSSPAKSRSNGRSVSNSRNRSRATKASSRTSSMKNREKDLSRSMPKDMPKGYKKDRIVAMARDPFWVHAYWEVTPAAVSRAEAAMGKQWHGAKPILRVHDISAEDTSSTIETKLFDIDIHGNASNWYINIDEPASTYRVDIGYLARGGEFYVLARSNAVNAPEAGRSDTMEERWSGLADEYGRLPESTLMGGALDNQMAEALRQPLTIDSFSSYNDMAMKDTEDGFWFKLDAELIVYGATQPHSRVTLQGEHVSLRSDGTFTMRYALPDSRQIIPAVAASPDGVQERTVVLAVERNTKELEPHIQGSAEE